MSLFSIIQENYGRRLLFYLERLLCWMVLLTAFIFPLLLDTDREISKTLNQKTFYSLSLFSLVLVGIRKLFLKSSFQANIIDKLIFLYMLSTLLVEYYLNNLSFANDSLIIHISALSLYYAYRMLSDVPDFKKLFVEGIVLSSFLISIYALFQYVEYYEIQNGILKVRSFFGNSAILGAYLSFVLPFSLYIICFEKGHNRTLIVLCIVNVILIIFLAYVIKSRVAIILSLAILSIFALFRLRERPKLSSIFYLLIVLTIIGLLLSFNFKTDSTNGRFLIWKISINILHESRSMIGIGIGNFESIYNNYQAKYFSTFPPKEEEVMLASESFYAFNEFLGSIIEQGIVGVFAFIVLIFIISKVLTKVLNGNDEQYRVLLPFIIAIISISIVGFVSYPLKELSILYLYVIIIAILSGSLKTKSSSRTLSRILNLIIIVVSTVAAILNYSRYTALGDLIRNLDTEVEESLLIEQAQLLPAHAENPVFLINYSKNLFHFQRYEECVDILKIAKRSFSCVAIESFLASSYTMLGNLREAEECYINAINMVPNRFATRYEIFNFYLRTNQTKKALEVGKDILDMPEKIQSVKASLIKNNVKERMYDLH